MKISDELKDIVNKEKKALKFVKHIEKHLAEIPCGEKLKVCCKICDKTIDEIWIEKSD